MKKKTIKRKIFSFTEEEFKECLGIKGEIIHVYPNLDEGTGYIIEVV